jgi:hypothetical protein
MNLAQAVMGDAIYAAGGGGERDNRRSSTGIVHTLDEVQRAIHEHYAKLGRAGGAKGGPARAAALTAEQRSEIARKGGIARREKLLRGE